MSSAADRKRLFNCSITLSDNVSLRLCQSFIQLCAEVRKENIDQSLSLHFYLYTEQMQHVATCRSHKEEKNKGNIKVKLLFYVQQHNYAGEKREMENGAYLFFKNPYVRQYYPFSLFVLDFRGWNDGDAV